MKIGEAPNELMKIVEITGRHNKWRTTETLNLIPSENVMSPLAEAVYFTDMMHRYAEGKPRKRYYQGLPYVDEIEELAMDLMSRLFKVKFVDLRPVSGTVANAATFRVLAPPGGKAVVAPVQAGAHVSHTKFGTLGALGIKHIEMPFDRENMNVDVDKASKLIEEVKPDFIVMGGSLYLFPHPLKELAEVAHSVGAKVVYDAAHVLGLIAGRRWRDPFDAGADVVTSSTHKTFPGPQGGVILSNNEEVFKEISRTIFPWFVSNHHLHRLPATAVTALEMIYFGEQYADQIIRNARAFAEALHEEGLDVVGEHLGFTRSHQVVLNVRKYGGGAKIAQLLEEANIIVNKNLLPEDPPEAVKDPSGIRTGVQEMTRYGMKEDDFREIARFFRKVIVDKKDPKEVAKEVSEFRKEFMKIHYAFDVDVDKIPSLYKIPYIVL
ncbi:MAG: serine hydroxymethyltransferase [Desulfurococcales archaeon]|nr:serine hydroxymethyltransferase [Desulfurococcales archaeon]